MNIGFNNNMNYELAKKLKESRFDLAPSNLAKQTIHEFDDGMFYQEPTLSELIEACGDNFHGVYIDGEKTWHAHGFKSENEFDDIYTTGESADEAVAYLWLAINKK